MEREIPFWYALITMFSLVSSLIAWMAVGCFVVRPIQKQLRANNEDSVSDWVIFPWKSLVYAWAIFYPLGRFNNGTTHFYSNPERMKAYASKTQWFLCALMEISGIAFLLLAVVGMVFFKLFGYW